MRTAWDVMVNGWDSIRTINGGDQLVWYQKEIHAQGGLTFMLDRSELLVVPDDQVSTHFYVADHLGSAQMEFSASGTPLSMSQFMPFGAEINLTRHRQPLPVHRQRTRHRIGVGLLRGKLLREQHGPLHEP